MEHGIGDNEFWRDIQRIQQELGLARQLDTSAKPFLP